ncbi:MAG: hypothetical protein D6696_19865, partial [Acidobacteria bacterium]
AKAGAAAGALARSLEARPLDPALRRRLEAFLERGDDPELEAALGQLSSNPIQQAFNLLMGGDPPA